MEPRRPGRPAKAKPENEIVESPQPAGTSLASQAVSGGDHFHFLVRSIIRTQMINNPEAVTAQQFNDLINDWIEKGWKVISCEVVGNDESVYTVAVALVR